MRSDKSRDFLGARGNETGKALPGHLWLTMTTPPDCSAVHMLMMGAMPMVVPWK